MKRSIVTLLLVFSTVPMLSNCGGENKTDTQTVLNAGTGDGIGGSDNNNDSTTVVMILIKVTPDDKNIDPGKSLQLKAMGTYAYVGTKTEVNVQDVTNAVSWTSSNDRVATVTHGKVTAVSTGVATIKAEWGGISGDAKVTVR